MTGESKRRPLSQLRRSVELRVCNWGDGIVWQFSKMRECNYDAGTLSEREGGNGEGSAAALRCPRIPELDGPGMRSQRSRIPGLDGPGSAVNALASRSRAAPGCAVNALASRSWTAPGAQSKALAPRSWTAPGCAVNALASRGWAARGAQ